MTQFSIAIDSPALAEAINHLAEAIKVGCSNQDYAESLADVAAHTEKTVPINPPVAPVPAPVAAEPATAPVQTVTPETGPVPVPAATPMQKTYTLDELSVASAELIDNGKMQQIMAIIQKYGVPAINLLRPDQYASYAADIRAIGGKI